MFSTASSHILTGRIRVAAGREENRTIEMLVEIFAPLLMQSPEGQVVNTKDQRLQEQVDCMLYWSHV